LKRVSSVIFDLDGTLLDTLEDLGDAVNRVLAARGFPTHPIESYRYFVGDGSAVLVERALPASVRSSEIYREILAAFLADYDQSWKIKTRIYDGIPEMLDSLTAQGIAMSVLSNKPHPFTVECVRELLSKWRFVSVLGLRPEVPRKPDPAGALETAQLLGVAPERILYLGDSGTDMKTAVAAGMFPAGALWGFRTREELMASGAAAVIQHPEELLGLL
jgi:phosphoglycolate phosphatase